MTPERLSQIEHLYHSARERERGERAAFLVEACKDDDDLRREVESLLAGNPSGACLLDEPVMHQAAGLFASGQSGTAPRLAPGLELGPYVIEAGLGTGGMGEVYRAKDKRLHRTVALKVLPQRLANTPGLRQRLEREAKVISSLNHPQICTLFDIGREGEIDYLVMEFLEGETLARRLQRGPLPLPEVLVLGIQIAGALTTAHAAGIVHRDLKPGNIMLTKSGAKLLDFGLAKVRPQVAGAPMSNPATPITTSGMLVGTVQYMSPEQIEGREADARSDVFAFGATLYEMLTGKRAFVGESQITVATAILEKDPEPLGNLQPLTPPALERAVRKCLAKNPEDRWQSTSDLESELRWIVEAGGTSVTASVSEAVARGRKRELLYGALAVTFLLAAIVSAASYWRLTRTPARAISSEITPPDKIRFISYVVGGNPRLSPDGRALAFSGADESGKTMLWVRSLDSPEARALPGTDDAVDPFWSADSRMLGFFAGDKLKSIEAAGGPAVVVADGCLNEGGGSWNRDGTILFVPDTNKGALYKVTGAGANPLPVLANDPNKVFVNPRFLPDGKHFLIASDSSDPAARGTYFASLDGSESRLVVGGYLLAIYASGFLLYVKGNTLMAQAFDPERGQLKGDPPQRVVDRVERAGDYFTNTIDATENSILIYRANGEFDQKRLTWFDRTGKNQGVTGEVTSYWDVRLSPDGLKLASNAGNRYSDIWVDDLARAVRTRLTIDPGTDHGVPVWSPDGSRIAFAVMEGKIRRGIYQKHSNGAGGEELLLADAARSIWPTSWSRDGRFLLYSREAARPEDYDIWILPLTGDHTPRPFVQARARAYDGEFSPDGRWVAYTSEESGRGEVYVVPFRASSILTTGPGLASAGAGGRWQVSATGGRSPRWRMDGEEIFYLSQANQIMAAELAEKGDSMVVGAARALFRCTPVPSIPSSEPYDVSPDGKKFVINSLSDGPQRLILLVNWTANLK